MHAWMEGRLSDDIVAEQRKVEEAEFIIFQVRGHSYLSCLTPVRLFTLKATLRIN